MQEFKLVADKMRSSKVLAVAIGNYFRNNNFSKKLLKTINNATLYFHAQSLQQVVS